MVGSFGRLTSDILDTSDDSATDLRRRTSCTGGEVFCSGFHRWCICLHGCVYAYICVYSHIYIYMCVCIYIYICGLQWLWHVLYRLIWVVWSLFGSMHMFASVLKHGIQTDGRLKKSTYLWTWMKDSRPGNSVIGVKSYTASDVHVEGTAILHLNLKQ